MGRSLGIVEGVGVGQNVVERDTSGGGIVARARMRREDKAMQWILYNIDEWAGAGGLVALRYLRDVNGLCKRGGLWQ